MNVRSIAAIAGVAAFAQAAIHTAARAQENATAGSVMSPSAVCMARTSTSSDARQLIMVVPAERQQDMIARGFTVQSCDPRPTWFARFKASACAHADKIPVSLDKLLAQNDHVSAREICQMANQAAQ